MLAQILALTLLLLVPVSSFAYELPAATWNTSTGKFDFQKAVNHKEFLAPQDVSGVAKFERNAVKILMPSEIVTQTVGAGVVAADMYKVVGAGANAGFLRRAIGLAGGVGTILWLGMSAKELYDWANSSPENKALFDQSQDSVYPPITNETTYKAGDILMSPMGPIMVDGFQWSISGLDGVYVGPYSINSGYSQMMLYKNVSDGSPKRYHTQEAYAIHSVPYPPPFNLASTSLDNFASTLAADDLAALKQFPNAQAALEKALANLASDPAKSQASASTRDVAALADLQAAVDANTNASQALADQLAELQRQYQEAQDKAAANPNEFALQQAVNELKRALDELTTKQAEQAAQEADEQAEESSMPESAADDLKEIDWTPLLALKGALTNVFPFNLLGQVGDLLGSLLVAPAAPVFNLPVGFGQVVTVDLSIFDPVASVCRWISALAMVLGSIFLVNAFYRGN